MIARADHDRPIVARQIQAILAAAYQVEARLIGVAEAGFPPLGRTVEGIAGSPNIFYLAQAAGAPVGVIELAPPREPGDVAVIDSLAVLPTMHRRGVGRALVAHVLAQHAGDLLVSTAVANAPAISLYESLGFVRHRRYPAPDGVLLVELKWRQA